MIFDFIKNIIIIFDMNHYFFFININKKFKLKFKKFFIIIQKEINKNF